MSNTDTQEDRSPFRNPPGIVCPGCGKHVSNRRRGHNCADCGCPFVPATAERLACDRCEHEDAARVLGAASEDYNRLCEDCVEWANSDDSHYSGKEVGE